MREIARVMQKGSLAAVITTLACLIFSANIFAQRQASSQLEEVIVTAEKREQNLQDVPMSVSAMDAAGLEKTFARDIHDLAGMSPNLIIDPILGSGTVSISIRGMQLNDVEKSFDPAVAVYQDGVYLATTTGALLNIWDAERVEVLRGPQGTLFGRNTIGGLVHVIRSKPTGEFGGKISATFAEDDQEDFKATINFPAFGNLSTKLTVMDSSGGGYFDNVIRNESEGQADMQMFSIGALWEPSDNFSLHLIYDDINDDTPTRPVTCTSEFPELFAAGTFLGLPANDIFVAGQCANKDDKDFHTKTFTSTRQDASVEVEAITLTANWQIAENHELVLVYGNREMDETALQEFDGFSADVFRTDRPQTVDQESFELRLQSDFSWGRSTVGAYYWDSDYALWQNTFFFCLFDPTCGTNPLAGFNDSPYTLIATESTSFFGQLDIDITDQLTLTLGGRYIDEEKTACQMFTAPSTDGSATFVDFSGYDKDITRAYGDCPSVASAYIDNNFTDPVTGAASVLEPTTSWSEFTPKVGLTYSTDIGMVYLSYTEGFRSGGYNGRATAASNLGPYDPEKVESWEIGFKSTWLNNTVQLNGSFFQTDYTDKQEDVILPGTDGAVTLTLVQNASAATMDGIELELLWIAVEGLTLNANMGFLNASYDSYIVTGPSGNPVDKTAFDLRKAPETTFTVGALWELPLANGNFLVSSINYRWKDDFWNNGNTGGPKHYSSDQLYVEAFGILDASINYETDNWRISVFGKNLTDEGYFMHAVDVGGAYDSTAVDPSPIYQPPLWSFATISRPRYFGAEIEYKF
ncbi:MAG: TonB-dependent receptor [Halieaceae bacterium]|nr:TonB-dependent receptor [Halieaceae bacterium]